MIEEIKTISLGLIPVILAGIILADIYYDSVILNKIKALVRYLTVLAVYSILCVCFDTQTALFWTLYVVIIIMTATLDSKLGWVTKGVSWIIRNVRRPFAIIDVRILQWKYRVITQKNLYNRAQSLTSRLILINQKLEYYRDQFRPYGYYHPSCVWSIRKERFINWLFPQRTFEEWDAVVRCKEQAITYYQNKIFRSGAMHVNYEHEINEFIKKSAQTRKDTYESLNKLQRDSNQCDGCARGLSVDKDGIHREGRNSTYCTADRYKSN